MLKITVSGLQSPLFSHSQKNLNMLSKIWMLEFFIIALTNLGSLLKDLPNSSQMNVVYKLNCMDCNASYVGQTGRLLKTRIAEHKNHINSKTTAHSLITDQ